MMKCYIIPLVLEKKKKKKNKTYMSLLHCKNC